MKKIITISLIILVAILGLVGAIWLAPTYTPTLSNADNTNKESPVMTEASTTHELAAGRYVDYDSSKVADTGFNETILFFHAGWCPECRAYDTALNSSTIPKGVQILKVDYDSSSDLRQKYGVTIQTTFVAVDASGAEVSKWVGYGKEKSIDAVLKNT